MVPFYDQSLETGYVAPVPSSPRGLSETGHVTRSSSLGTNLLFAVEAVPASCVRECRPMFLAEQRFPPNRFHREEAGIRRPPIVGFSLCLSRPPRWKLCRVLENRSNVPGDAQNRRVFGRRI